MPFYLYQLAYSPEAIKAMVANPSDRKAAAAKLVEAAGGKLHEFFFCFGKYDVVCMIEAPDDAARAAAALAVAAAGTSPRRHDQAPDRRGGDGGDEVGRQGGRRLQAADGLTGGGRRQAARASPAAATSRSALVAPAIAASRASGP